MKRLELMQLHWDLCGEARKLMLEKNQDYGGVTDPFANFREDGLYGIIVRMHDKMSRLRSFARKGSFAFKAEGVRDDCVDLINYAILFEGMVIDDHANGSRSYSGGDKVAGGPRPAYSESGPGTGYTDRGVWRGGAGGGGTGPGTEAVPAPGPGGRELESRTGAGDRRSKPVGSKSGRRKGAR